jgi:hypothetical protein
MSRETPLPCHGRHAYEQPGRHGDGWSFPSDAASPPPYAEYNAEGTAFDDWQLAHLNPCKCGADTVAITPCEIHCVHCGAMVAGQNWLDIVADWQRENPEFPDGGEHPSVESCDPYDTFPKSEE